MAVLTVDDKRLREVDEFAQEVERSREDVVNEAIDRYLRIERFERLCAWGQAHASRHGITEDDIVEAVKEVRGKDGRNR